MIIEPLVEDFITPVRKTPHAAAYDIFNHEERRLTPGLYSLPLGFKMQLPPDRWANLRCRSSLALIGCSVEAGVIDADYRGEVKLLLRVRQPIILQSGKAIAQMVILPYLTPAITLGRVDSTERGEGGFGSTDS